MLVGAVIAGEAAAVLAIRPRAAVLLFSTLEVVSVYVAEHGVCIRLVEECLVATRVGADANVGGQVASIFIHVDGSITKRARPQSSGLIALANCFPWKVGS